MAGKQGYLLGVHLTPEIQALEGEQQAGVSE